jgi:hypothetical protein
MPGLVGTCCNFCGCGACSGSNASATFGLGRQSEESFDGRGEPLAVSASPAPHVARNTMAGGLTSVCARRTGGAVGDSGGGCLGGKAFLVAGGRLTRSTEGSSGVLGSW